MAEKDKEAEEVKEAKAQARRGTPRNQAPVEDKESASERDDRREAVEEARFDGDRLVAEAVRFDVSHYTLAGALALKPNQKNFTHDEVRELLDEYRSREVVPVQ